MSAKVMNEQILGTDFDRINKLAASIKQHHTEINQAQETISAEKKEIMGISRTHFFDDLENPEHAPEVVGNHEFHVEDGIVTVNFKVKSPTMSEINKKPAAEVLKEACGDVNVYDKLFEESDTITPGATPEKMLEQALDHPELFRIQLNETLSPGQLAQLVKEHPDWVEVGIKDLTGYANFYPDCTIKHTIVKTQLKFLDRVSKLDTAVRTRLRGFLKRFLRDTLDMAVICGNANKTK